MSPTAFSIAVNVSPTPYKVQVEPGLLQRLGAEVRKLTSSAKLCLVTDSNLQKHHLPTVLASLQGAGFHVLTAINPAGEQHKTFAQINHLYSTFLPAGIDRKTPLLALGGGVVGDMTGFAAATILRGVPFIQVPTTLLSMVDASVGGKTGIDHPCGKNLIGAFHQPRGVFIDPATLLTLPQRELASGLAECIKHDIIRDAAHFALLEKNISLAIQRDVNYLAALIAHNVAIKARVVEADPFEKAERAHLNFGHTFGHAFEKVSNYQYSHGEAVALGIVAASHLACDLGMLDAAMVQRIIRLLSAAGLPTGKLTLDADACVAAMAFDKKNLEGSIRFVLPDQLGHVVIRNDIPTSAVIRAIACLKG